MASTVNLRTGTYVSGGGITFNISDTHLGYCQIPDCGKAAMVAIDLGGQGGIRCPEHYEPWTEMPQEA